MSYKTLLLGFLLACKCALAAPPEVPHDKNGAISWRTKRIAEINQILAQPDDIRVPALGEMLWQFEDLDYRSCDELVEITSKLRTELLAIPGHAQYFGDRIRAAYEPLRGPNPVIAVGHAQDEMMYGFATLRHLPSPENVKVLGDMLSETWRMAPTEGYPPPSLALSAIVGALVKLPLREAPKLPTVMAWEDPEVVKVHPWQAWYEEVKSGRKTFSFKGQSVEYRFRPDGTWETLAMVNPPDDGSKVAGRVERPGVGRTEPGAGEIPRGWVWLVFPVILAAVFGIWFVSRKFGKGL